MHNLSTSALPRNPFHFLLAVTRPHGSWAALSFVAVLAAQLFYSTLPLVFQHIVDGANGYAAHTGSLGSVGFWVAMYPVFVVAGELLYRVSGFTGMRWSTGARATAHVVLFDYLSRHSATYFANRFAGALTSSITNVVNGVGNMIELFLWQYFATILRIGIGLILVWTASPTVMFVFLGWLAVILPLNIFFMSKIEKYSKRSADGLSKLRGVTVDVLTNILAVTQFARRTNEVGRVAGVADEQRRLALKSWFTSEIGLTINSLLMGGFVVSMTASAFYFWSHGTMTLGQFVLVFTLTMDLIGAFVFLGPSLNRVAELFGESKEGLSEILQPYEITDYPKAKPLGVVAGTITYESVGFSYGTRPVFKGFSVMIQGGERVGIVGPSGSGKTTFVSLLLRQQDVHEGQVMIDGQNIRKVTLESLRSAIAIVPQDPMLFHRTIRENIAYGKPSATLEEIAEAAKRAEADDFIKDLPDGYDTLVGERGVKLSGGQRQRVAIARAILKAAPILVLDEATSSLDSESESAIQKALTELMTGKTVIAIAHRLSTIRAMDRIIVIEDGMIREDGTHDDLIAKEGTYARLWAHQAGGFLSDV